MTLPLQSLTWQGLTLGGYNEDAQLAEAVLGLGQPPRTTKMMDRHGGGQEPGTSRDLGREVTASITLDTARAADLYATVVGSMAVRPDPTDVLPLSFAGLLWPGECRVYARPEKCDPVMDEEAVHEDHVALDLQWLASDPTIYSEALHVFDTAELEATAPANSWTVTLNNAGTSAATAARHGLRVVITPATRCVGPRVMVPLRGEVVTWPGLVIEVGQVFRWEADGTSWIGGQQVSGRRTPFTAPLVLRPGDQDLNIDCTSGTFDVRTEHRDTFA